MTDITPLSLGTTRRRAVADRWTFTSMCVAVLLTALLGLVTSSCGGDKALIVGATPQDLGSLTVAAGDSQIGTVGSMLASPLTVKVLTQSGEGVPGIDVQWTFSAGGGSLTANGPVADSLISTTDKSGETSVYWQLDTIAGDQVATATLPQTDQTASSSSKQVKFHSRGKAASPATIVVSPAFDTLMVGDSTQLSATVLDRWKNVVSGDSVTDPGFTWRSLASSIASVSSSGLVTAKVVGATAIIVTAACCGSDTAAVQVSTSGTSQTPTVTVTPSSLSFTSVGATAQLSAVATDSTGNTVGNPGFTWKSLDSSIASVSSTGMVTAQAAGTTAVIVTAACCGSDTAAVEVSTSGPAQTLLSEGFEDGNLASRGWFDATSVSIANDARPGSSGTHSLQWHWAKGTTAPQGSSRFDFTPGNSVYVSYWIKFSSNWIGSGKAYHPHLFHVLTTADDHYIGPSITHLTLYDEMLYLNGNLVAQLGIQDALMIDQSNLNVDLRGVTEQRSIGGYNGQHEFDDSISTVGWDLYLASPGQYTNYKLIRPRGVTIPDADKNQWHHVESYWQLNSIVNGIGQQDGVLQYWVDGVLRVDRHDVYYRTGANPTMQFRTFLMAPYIGDGSPVDQYIWVDDLLLATKRP